MYEDWLDWLHSALHSFIVSHLAPKSGRFFTASYPAVTFNFKSSIIWVIQTYLTISVIILWVGLSSQVTYSHTTHLKGWMQHIQDASMMWDASSLFVVLLFICAAWQCLTSFDITLSGDLASSVWSLLYPFHQSSVDRWDHKNQALPLLYGFSGTFVQESSPVFSTFCFPPHTTGCKGKHSCIYSADAYWTQTVFQAQVLGIENIAMSKIGRVPTNVELTF